MLNLTVFINMMKGKGVKSYCYIYKHDKGKGVNVTVFINMEKVLNVTVFINMMKGKGVKCYCIYKHDERKRC